MAASKLLQKHLFFRSSGLQLQAYHETFPSLFFKKKMKIKNISSHNGHLITSESPTTSAKALNAEYFEQTKSAVSKGNVFNV